ncbi:MAG: DUF1292 domain-containing protein [Bacillota bacterium]|nr:DUF1292 domain-containing protein [Bacillota bacterium]
MEEKEIMSFKDVDGNKVDFEVVAEIEVDDKDYLILSPVDGDEDDAFAFRVDNEDGKTVYNFVEDDEEFQKVQEEYKSLLDEE